MTQVNTPKFNQFGKNRGSRAKKDEIKNNGFGQVLKRSVNPQIKKLLQESLPNSRNLVGLALLSHSNKILGNQVKMASKPQIGSEKAAKRTFMSRQASKHALQSPEEEGGFRRLFLSRSDNEDSSSENEVNSNKKSRSASRGATSSSQSSEESSESIKNIIFDDNSPRFALRCNPKF